MTSILVRLFVVVLAFQLLLPPQVWAQAVQPANYDLTSTNRNVSAPAAVNLNLSGTTRTVNPGDMLTPAENVALMQLMNTGSQSVQLGLAGNAVAGTVSASQLSGIIGNLVIPQGVTALQNAEMQAALNITGNLTNAGNFYAYSTNAAVTNAIINANNIFNAQGAVLSSILPSSLGIATAVGQLNLHLNALNDIVNSGTISSSGSLSLSAGGSIVNALPANVTGSAPVMQALNDLNLQAANVVNRGQMQAFTGNVGISNPSGNQLNVDNALGQITAGNNVVFGTLASSTNADGSASKALLSLKGGDVTGNQILFHSPEGMIKVDAHTLNGAVTVDGGGANVGTRHGNLNIAAMNLTGDPIYFAQDGDLTISYGGTSGQDFVALAGGNIGVSGTPPAGATIDATNSTAGAVGGKITMQAGVAFTITGDANCASCSDQYTIDGASATGGNINVPVMLRTNSNDVYLKAREGTASAGTINIGGIETSGAGSNGSAAAGGGGNITIESDGALTTGFLRAYGGGGAGGASAGARGGGAGGTVSVSSVAGDVTINGDVNTSGGGGGASNFSAGAGGDGGNITISNGGANLVINGPVLAAGGGGAGNRAECCGAGGGGSFGGGGGGDGGTAGGGFYAGSGSAGGGIFSNQCCSAGYNFGNGGSGEQNNGAPVGGDGGGTGGAAGSGGQINITGNQVRVTKTVGTYYPTAVGGYFTSNGPYNQYSVYAGTNGSINITQQNTLPSVGVAFDADGNFEDASRHITFASATGVVPFVGSASMAGALNAGQGVFVNSVNYGTNVTDSSTLTVTAPVTIALASGSRTLNFGDLLTPAEFVAVLQLTTNPNVQTIQLGDDGNATGGSMYIQSANLPSGGFNLLKLPNGLTSEVSASSISVINDTTLKGTMNANSDLTLSSNVITITPTGQLNAFSNLALQTNVLTSTGTINSTVPNKSVTFTSNTDLQVNSITALNVYNNNQSSQQTKVNFLAPNGSIDLFGSATAADIVSLGGGDVTVLAGKNIRASSPPSGAWIQNFITGGNYWSGNSVTLGAGVTYGASGRNYNVTGSTADGGNVTLGAVNISANSSTLSVVAKSGAIAAGTVDVGVLDVSGAGGAGATTTNGSGSNGWSAGSISINAPGDITTGALRAFGGGGGGSGTYDGTNVNGGGNGGSGGTIGVTSTAGAVHIMAEVNSSGGGGGSIPNSYVWRSCWFCGWVGVGPGTGGNGGNVSVSGVSGVTVDGALLAASGGSGRHGGGGGSFGGGGGASPNASNLAGGGGFFGGGSSVDGLPGSGGGIFGGGAGAPGANSGSLGLGGDGALFGMGGGNSLSSGAAGRNGDGYAVAGNSGSVTLTGATVAVTKTLGSGMSQSAGDSFASNEFAGRSIIAGSITLNSGSDPSALNLAGPLQSSGGTVIFPTTSPSVTVSMWADTGRTVNLAFPSTGTINIPTLEFMSRGGTIALNIPSSSQAVNLANMQFSLMGDDYVGPTLTLNTGGTLNVPALVSSAYPTTFNLTGAAGVTLSGYIDVRQSTITVSAINGGITAAGDITNSQGTSNFTAGAGGVTLQNVFASAGYVTINSGGASGGAVTIGNVDLSGMGGGPASSGQSGGQLSITAHGAVQTGWLRSFGGGGGGTTGVGNPCCDGGPGGYGGSVSITSQTEGITVNGDINTSGGGGGMGYWAYGGGGGAIGLSAINGNVVVNGPLLAAAGGNGHWGVIGAAFGGGGGGAYYGTPGASGFYGGGQSVSGGGPAGGGGYQGPGLGTNGGADGGLGVGGGSETYGFGESPSGHGNDVMVSAHTSGTVSLSAQTISINKTIATGFGPLITSGFNPFTESAYKDIAVAGGSISLNASQGLPGLSVAGDVSSSGGTVFVNATTFSNRVVHEGYGTAVSLAFASSGDITLPTVAWRYFYGSVNVNTGTNQNVAVGPVVTPVDLNNGSADLRVTTGGSVTAPTLTSLSRNVYLYLTSTASTVALSGLSGAGPNNSLTLSGDQGVSITGLLAIPGASLYVTANHGSVSLAGVDVSGLGGSNGGGYINISARDNVETGYLRAFGGGGSGGTPIGCCNGGSGGGGGSIGISSSTGSITVDGDINTSGGGGGGGGWNAPGGSGGAITLTASGGDITVNGPVLAANGGDGSGNYGAGGGSFGGGGGAFYVTASGGGGFYGGGGAIRDDNHLSPGTGGGFGSGGTGANGGENGELGYGGGGNNFGQGTLGNDAMQGQNQSGAVSITAKNVTIAQTISGLAALTSRDPNPFTSSAYNDVAVAGGNISLNATNGGAALSVAGDVASSGGSVYIGSSAFGHTVSKEGYGKTVNLSFAGTDVVVPTLKWDLYYGTINLSSSSGQNFQLGQLIIPANFNNGTADLNVNTAGNITATTLNLDTRQNLNFTSSNGTITLQSVIANGNYNGLTLSGKYGVTTDAIFMPGTSVTLTASQGSIVTGELTLSGISGGGYGGSLYATAGYNVTVNGNVRTFGAGGGGGGIQCCSQGGYGGGGGAVNVTATNGSVRILGDINTSGGGGGAGTNCCGSGGGSAGQVQVTAGGLITIGGPILAAGGGGGGSRDGGASLGGGGGASAVGGAGGSGFYGGGGTVCCVGGAGGGYALGSGLGVNGAPDGGNGLGSDGSLFGNPTNSGNAGGVGSSGNGGQVVLTAKQVEVKGSVGSYYGGNFTSSPLAGYSIVTLGNQGKVTISSTGVHLLASTFDSDGNYESGTTHVTVPQISGEFIVGGTPNGSGTAGGIKSGNQLITINGTNTGLSDITSATYGSAGGTLSITYSDNSQLVVSAGMTVTPAEWVALVQSSLAGQTVVLNSVTRNATGGTILFEGFAPANLTDLVVSSGLTVNLGSAPLTVFNNTSVRSGGTLSYPGGLVSSNITNDGVLTGGTIQSKPNESLNVTGTGSLSGNNSFSSSGGLSVSQSAISGTVAATAAAGTVSITVATGSIRVGTNSTVSATQGNVVLTAADALSGSISLGANSQINATSTVGQYGHVYLIVGIMPESPVSGTTPDNVSVHNINQGAVYFGDNGIAATAPSNTVNTDSANVVFSTGSLSPTAISLGGGVIINAQSVPLIPLITSLDLTDSNALNQLLDMQTAGNLGGHLQVRYGVLSGTLLLTPERLGSNLTSLNIPQGVTVSFQGFQTNSPLNIALTSASTTKQVTINGVQQFLRDGSTPTNGVISITSDQAGPVLVMGSAGMLSSDDSLTINANGSVSLSTITAPTLGVNLSAGDINLTKVVTATTANLTTSGNIVRANSPQNLNVQNLTMNAANVGTAFNAITTQAANLAVNATNAYFSQTGSMNITAASVAGTLQVISGGSGTLSTSGAVSAGRLNLTNNVGGIEFGGTTTAANAAFTTGGSGAFAITSGGSLTVSNPVAITMKGSGGLSLSGNLSVGANKLTLDYSGHNLTMGSEQPAGTPDTGYQFGSWTASKITAGMVEFRNVPNISVVGDYDMSSSGAAVLSFPTLTSFTGSSTGTMHLGSNALRVTASGPVVTGNIIGGPYATQAQQVSFNSSSTITVNGSVTAGGNGQVVLVGSGMDITEAGSIDAGNGQVILQTNAGQSIAIGDSTDGNGNDAAFDLNTAELSRITAGSLSIRTGGSGSLSVQGNIDLTGSTGAFNLDANIPGTFSATGQTINLGNRALKIVAGGDINTGTVIGGSGGINFSSRNSIVVDGTLTTTNAGVIYLTSTAGNGSVSLGANVGGSTSVVNVTANGSGSITQIAGTVSGTTLNATSGTGSIGPLTTSVAALTANTGGSGVVNINSTAPNLKMGNSTAGGDFILNASGNLTANSVGTQNGKIALTSGGNLTVGSNAVIFAKGGDAILRSTNTSSGTITIGSGATVKTFVNAGSGVGNVYMVIGAIPVTPVAGATPNGVTPNKVSSGEIYYGNGITATGSNAINAIAKNVVFSTGGRPASAIKLSGGTTITADPPVSVPFTLLQGKVENNESLVWGQQSNTEVKASGVPVHIANDTAALIKTENGVVKISNVYSNGKPVVAEINGRNFTVEAGTELVIGPSTRAITNSMQADHVGRRHTQMEELSASLAVAKNEVSLISLMQHSDAIVNLLKSGKVEDQKMHRKLMKMAAAIMQVTASRGMYTAK